MEERTVEKTALVKRKTPMRKKRNKEKASEARKKTVRKKKLGEVEDREFLEEQKAAMIRDNVKQQ
jgi:hypothetical protein